MKDLDLELQVLETKIRKIENANALARATMLMPLLWQLLKVLRLMAVK